MKLKSALCAAVAIGASLAVSSVASAAGTFGVTYFSVPTVFGTDFGVCCESPPATSLVINLGSVLGANGLPVAEAGSNVGDIDPMTGEVLWWKAHSSIIQTGTGTLPLPLVTQNMFAPNATGGNNNTAFLTAILSGNFSGTGSPQILSVTSDDDAYVYLDGKYVGGNPGVHGASTVNVNLGTLTGLHNLKVFYADRAQVDAKLGLTGVGLDTLSPGVPEPATWAMMIMGFGLAGATLRRRRASAAA